MARGRVSALSLPVGDGAAVEFKSFASRTPLLSLACGRSAGGVLVTLTLPEHLTASDVAFARRLAERAAAYASEVERLYRGGRGRPVGRAASGAGVNA